MIRRDGWFCTACNELCEMYEQGLSCKCDNPWETEVIHEEDYPKQWVEVKIIIHRRKHKINERVWHDPSNFGRDPRK